MDQWYDCQLPQYKFNPSKFVEFSQINRDHQQAAIAAASNSVIGQILAPCGTGKTRIQVCIHIKDMIEKTFNQQTGVYVIASHRLTLNNQLSNELIPLAIDCGISFNSLFVGSGRPDVNKYYTMSNRLIGYTKTVSEMIQSLSHKKIEEFIDKSKKQNRHVIIVSTYDSIDKLANIGSIDLLTCDEAHNTTEYLFTENLAKIKPIIKRQYFFTATRKIRGSDGGMNDKKFYGDILYEAPPVLMLKAGEIACPKFHIVSALDDGKTTNTNMMTMMVKNVMEAFLYHRKCVAEHSADSNQIAAKLLISCSGIDDMEKIYNNSDFREFAQQNNIKCFAISSSPNGPSCNWKDCGKERFLEELNNLEDQQEAIIFNVDMLTEGIDLPAITGVMPLRHMNFIKLFQLLGRCLRLHRNDRENICNNILMSEGYKNYIKPYGSIIISKHLTSLSLEYKDMIKFIKTVMKEYGLPAEELIVQDQFIDTQHDDLDSIIPFDKDSKIQFDLHHREMDVISDTNLSQFEEEMPVNIFEKKKYFERMLSTYEASA